ncbi:hypothetical protein L0669_00835 [Flavobacterium bizetiae]|uniref:DUF6850 family outer membrane beta-barrel protein n=1 Tax=Flavobacterium bizetiae TaxID=2704140 RepID=UPI0021E7BCBB|nr:DUF6850 family outer membrane beta-barrel protein [Flavobacterium bizetiae]UTN04461.1 hypothetical protein L0669_00835 [Flavobacterium bizetiae]
MSFRFILLFFIFSSGILHAQDSTSVLLRIRENQLPENNFSNAFYTNPANMHYARHYSLSQLSAGYNNSSQQTNIQQLGNGIRQFLVNAQSYYKIDAENTVWGNAHYKNGQRKNVQWNESSDFQIIYPYVTADSIGGNLSFEEYSFKGGYTKAFQKTTLGIVADYRALMEYRDTDPRPKNTVSDLNVAVGLSQNIGNHYAIGTSVNLQKYTQSNNLKFFSELGAPAVYHMTGLGMYSNWLTGNKLSSFYDGKGYGANVQFFPKDRNGFALSVGYNHFDYEKIMTEFQNLIASSILEKRYEGEVSYLKKSEERSWGTKVEFYYSYRAGTENIFDNQTTTSYVKISEYTKYTNQVTSVLFSGLYSIPNPEFSWSVAPGFNLKNTATKYIDPLRKVDVQQAISRIDFSVSKLFSKSLINLSTSFEHSWALDAKMNLSDRTETNQIFEMLDYNFDYLSSAYTKVNLAWRWDYKYAANLNFFAKAGFDYYNYSNNKNNTYFQMSLGLTF